MKYSVDYHPVELVGIFCSYLFSIGADGVETYDNISVDDISFSVVKRDDICEIVMAEKLVVYLQNLFVITKQVCYVANLFSIFLCHILYPCRCLSFCYFGHGHVFCLIAYHGCWFNFSFCFCVFCCVILMASSPLMISKPFTYILLLIFISS